MDGNGDDEHEGSSDEEAADIDDQPLPGHILSVWDMVEPDSDGHMQARVKPKVFIAHRWSTGWDVGTCYSLPLMHVTHVVNVLCTLCRACTL